MECNKDEAVRVKELAEKKIAEKNYATAKKIALKAQSLYPDLEGLPQMLTVLDVYVSAENKINGEVDWYGILSVSPFADQDMIRKQYRKLAFMLHPDKNKSLGAEGAFKLISEAWSLLSDHAKRLDYNRTRNLKGFQPQVPSRTGGPSAHPGSSNFQNVMNSASSNARAQHGPNPVPPHAGTFWTVCNQCKTHFQYLRIYLNNVLICPSCEKTFIAVENSKPPNLNNSFRRSSSQQNQKSRHRAASGSSGRNSTVPQNLGAGGSSSNMTSPGTTVASGDAAAPSVSAAQQASEKAKTDEKRRQSIAEWERNQKLMGKLTLKKRRADDNHLNGHKGGTANQTSKGNDGADVGGVSELGKGNTGTKRVYGFSRENNRPNVARELPYPEMKNILMWKARTGICKMLKENSLAAEADKKSLATEAEKVKVNKKQKSVVYVGTTKNSDIVEEVKSAVSINVPDPDFHNFDLDRTESSFGEDQVWAAYDNDGMPRFYARIQKVVSLKPFKVRISWLNSRSNSELGPLNWVGSGFAKTCGDFRPGRHETSVTLNSFSNKVSWTKSTRGVIRIFPRKGEVWALYRNWSPEWNEDTPEALIEKYDMVEVLDDFTEENGVAVVPLSKVAGFRTVFCKQMDANEVRRIPKEEMFRFSHQVPSHLLTGKEAHNAPNGCWELDPAALPAEFHQVITEAGDNRGKTKEENFEGASTKEVNGGGMEKQTCQEVVKEPMTTEVGQGN